MIYRPQTKQPGIRENDISCNLQYCYVYENLYDTLYVETDNFVDSCIQINLGYYLLSYEIIGFTSVAADGERLI